MRATWMRLQASYWIWMWVSSILTDVRTFRASHWLSKAHWAENLALWDSEYAAQERCLGLQNRLCDTCVKWRAQVFVKAFNLVLQHKFAQGLMEDFCSGVRISQGEEQIWKAEFRDSALTAEQAAMSSYSTKFQAEHILAFVNGNKCTQIVEYKWRVSLPCYQDMINCTDSVSTQHCSPDCERRIFQILQRKQNFGIFHVEGSCHGRAKMKVKQNSFFTTLNSALLADEPSTWHTHQYWRLASAKLNTMDKLWECQALPYKA